MQNENRSRVPTSLGNSSLPKERESVINAIKVSGIKRPPSECLASLPEDHSRRIDATTGHFVYVRRKSEAVLRKSNTCDKRSNNAHCPHMGQLGHNEETTQLMHTLSRKPTDPPLGKTGNRLPPAEANYPPITSAIPFLDNPRGMKSQHWEERNLQLQRLLRKLDQSNQEDYLQMLRSLSSIDLSRHAVKLERRSIQLSLEEGKELQRVGAFNILEKL